MVNGQKSKVIKVMGFGTFDGLHPGHLEYLKQLKDLGDEVIIIIARDENVKKIKNRLPRFNEGNRLAEAKKTGLADKVLLGHKNDFYKCIRENKPNVIGLGYDQKADTAEIQKLFPDIRIVRLKAFQPEKYKSSRLNHGLSFRRIATR